jgi:hypothetical protein
MNSFSASINLFLVLGWLILFGASSSMAQPEIKVEGKLYTNMQSAQIHPDSVIRLRLKRKGYREIPAEVFKMVHLKELDLSANRIKKIPAELYSLKHLEIIRFTRNRIVTIEPGISSLRQLRYLDLGMNPIQSLPEETGQIPNLEYLQIWGTEISALPESFERMSQLKWLDMRNIILTDSEREDLYQQLPKVKIFLSEGCNCGK